MSERTPYVLRMPPELHERLKALAGAEGKSMNQVITAMLRREVALHERRQRRIDERTRHAAELAAALDAPLPEPDPITRWLERQGIPPEQVVTVGE